MDYCKNVCTSTAWCWRMVFCNTSISKFSLQCTLIIKTKISVANTQTMLTCRLWSMQRRFWLVRLWTWFWSKCVSNRKCTVLRHVRRTLQLQLWPSALRFSHRRTSDIFTIRGWWHVALPTFLVHLRKQSTRKKNITTITTTTITITSATTIFNFCSPDLVFLVLSHFQLDDRKVCKKGANCQQSICSRISRGKTTD